MIGRLAAGFGVGALSLIVPMSQAETALIACSTPFVTGAGDVRAGPRPHQLRFPPGLRVGPSGLIYVAMCSASVAIYGIIQPTWATYVYVCWSLRGSRCISRE